MAVADQKTKPCVIIVGGGFAGLECARALAAAPVDIVLIDRQNHHCFQPLLYQVATAALSPADIAWPIRAILSRQTNLRVIMAEVTAVDTKARIVQADALCLPYDYLVLASGVTHAYFGHDEWADGGARPETSGGCARDPRAFPAGLRARGSRRSTMRPAASSSPSSWSAAARPASRWRARWRRSRTRR